MVLDGSVDALYKQLGNTDYAFYHGTMRLATIKLKEMLERNAALKKQFTKEQLDDIQAGRERSVARFGIIMRSLTEIVPSCNLWMKSYMESVIIRVEVILGILSIWNNLTGYSMDSKSKGVHVCLAISRNYV